jgi:hypothetical protein
MKLMKSSNRNSQEEVLMVEKSATNKIYSESPLRGRGSEKASKKKTRSSSRKTKSKKVVIPSVVGFVNEKLGDDIDLDIKPLDPHARDDDSIVLSDRDRYQHMERREINETKTRHLRKAEVKIPLKRKPKNVQSSHIYASESVDSYSTLDSTLEPEVNPGCVNVIDGLIEGQKGVSAILKSVNEARPDFPSMKNFSLKNDTRLKSSDFVEGFNLVEQTRGPGCVSAIDGFMNNESRGPGCAGVIDGLMMCIGEETHSYDSLDSSEEEASYV